MSVKKDRIKVKNRINNKASGLRRKRVDSIRLDIDRIDNRIHKLLIDRASLVLKVFEAKKSVNNGKLELYRPDREYSVLSKIVSRHKGLFPIKAIVASWSEFFSGYRSMQGKLNISYLNSDEMLVKNHFGMCANYVGFDSCDGAIGSLLKKKSDVAALPFPNKKNKWFLRLPELKTIKIIGAVPFNITGFPNLLILSKQNREHPVPSVVLILIKTKKNYFSQTSNYLNDNGFVVHQGYKLDEYNSYILSSIHVKSEENIRKKINTIKNTKKIGFPLLAIILGGYAFSKKDMNND